MARKLQLATHKLHLAQLRLQLARFPIRLLTGSLQASTLSMCGVSLLKHYTLHKAGIQHLRFAAIPIIKRICPCIVQAVSILLPCRCIFTLVRRFLAALLAILVLALSIFPCNDAVGETSDKAQTVCAAADADHCPLHSADACSPFCACSCCAGITVPAVFSLKAAWYVNPSEAPVAIYIARQVSVCTPPVWQPPRAV